MSVFDWLTGWLTDLQFVNGNRSFRTQVISYHFGQFVSTFIFNLVISKLHKCNVLTKKAFCF